MPDASLAQRPPALRLGTHPLFLRSLLARLHSQTVPPAATSTDAIRPLAALTTRAPDDPAIALLDAWAIVADVLAFYGERILVEGYLDSAGEERSLLELARLIGYELRPGLAASTPLAFSVGTAPGLDPVVQIDAGLRVQSIPGQDQLPQTFETIEPLAARPEWNALRLDPAYGPPPTLTRHAQATRLAGVSTGLRPGDRMLVVEGASGARYLPLVAAAEPERAAGYTTLTWNAALGDGEDALNGPQVFAFRRQARLFGHNAPRPPAGGIYRYDPALNAWTQLHLGAGDREVLALCVYRRGDTTNLFAGTAGGGVYRSADDGATWSACNAGLGNLTVHALCVDSKQRLYAGTTDGAIFRSLDDGATWEAWSSAVVQHTRFLRLKDGKDGKSTLLDDYQPSALPDQWALSGGLPKKAIRALAVNGTDFFATVDDASYVSRDNGKTWAVSPTQTPEVALPPSVPKLDPSFGPVRALAVLDEKSLIWVATPLRPGATATDWSGFALARGQTYIDLDTLDESIASGSWIGLVNAGAIAAYQVERVSAVARSDFTLAATATRLTLRGSPQLAPFYGTNLRGTSVLLQSQQLPLEPGPLAGDTLVLERPIPPLEPGRRIVVCGTLANEAGNQTDGEATTIAQMPDARTIRLAGALKRSYERASVTLYANVALASHGESVADEVLGSGDGALANQRFALKHLPLTYVPASTDSGARAELEVRVNDVLWSEAASLNDLDARSQSYVVRRDGDGQTRIVFGDGVRGARLPSGVENVVATYRYGLGPAGEVNANSLSLLQTRPLGVQEVTNPLPATGGATPESGASARANAPLTVLTMDRVVSLADFEHFVSGFIGIGAVQATLLWAGDARLVHITVADTNGNPVPAGSALLQALRESLDRRRNRRQPVTIDSYAPQPFHLVATLFVDPRYRPPLVVAAAELALRAAFSFRQRALGQPIYHAEVIAAIQPIPGVVAVDVDVLALGKQLDPGSPAELLNRVLPASRARWDETRGRVLPAELLVLEQVVLQTKVAA